MEEEGADGGNRVGVLFFHWSLGRRSSQRDQAYRRLDTVGRRPKPTPLATGTRKQELRRLGLEMLPREWQSSKRG